MGVIFDLQWSGRFGNNLMQLSFAIYLSQKTNSVLNYPSHPIIKNKIFDFSNKNCTEHYKSNFWINSITDLEPFKKKFGNIDFEEYQMAKPKILKEYIMSLIPYSEIDIDYDLVFHIRGGDVFKHPTHPLYVQSPLCFYEKIIELENPESVLLVCEDLSNPLIPYISDMCRNCTVRTGNIIDDMNILMNCKTLAIGGETTFSRTLAQLSKKIKKVYVPCYEGGYDYIKSTFKLIGSELIFIEHNNYINVTNWKFNEEQKELMFNLEAENLTIKK